jgi:hypothetical protein
MGKKGRKKQTGKLLVERVRIDTTTVMRPEDGSYDQAKQGLIWRMQLNLSRAGHPLHHMTANGAIVEPDPVVETLMTHVSPDEMPPIPEPHPAAPPAVPVIRDWYEREPGRTWMAMYVEQQKRNQ